MPTGKKPTLHYRPGDEQARIIEEDLVPSLEQYDSLSDFTRQAINSQARPLRSIASGGNTAKRLVNLFSEVRHIDVELPDRSAEARIKNEDLRDNTSISLEPQVYSWLKDIQKETNLGRGEATRYCKVIQLAEVAKGTDVLPDWAEVSLILTSRKLRNSLVRPKLSLFHIFVEHFTVHLEDTEYFIERDPRPFRDFSEAYRDDFYETQSYDQLTELGERAINNVENTIEERTDISLANKSGLAGFLAEQLQE